jgi:hypothetical protein
MAKSTKAQADHGSHTTTDHEEIRRWAEARGGRPATVERTSRGDEAGVLRIDFPGGGGSESLEEITWDEFFEKFDEAGLAFLYQEHTADGGESRFCKLVRREPAGAKAGGKSSKASGRTSKPKASRAGATKRTKAKR